MPAAILGAFIAGSQAMSASADAPDAGDLKIYDFVTQIGTVASRTFRDSAGRVSRIIYYTSHKLTANKLDALQQADLRPQSMELYYYNDNGQRRKLEKFDGNQKLTYIVWFEYGPDGTLVRQWQTSPEGIKSSETRFASGRKATEVEFDATGKHVVTMRGVVQPDIDLPHGWGDAVNGAACGIALTRERGRLDEIQVRLNLRTVPVSPPFQMGVVNAVPDARMLLRDAAGNDIPEAGGSRHSRQWHLPGTEVGHLVPGYPLAERFPGLPKGRYTLRVQLTVPDLGMTLLSNEVAFVVE